MSQPQYGFTVWGTNGTSTGIMTVSTGPVTLHTVNILSSGTGTFILYNATASSTGTVAGVYTVGAPASFMLDAVYAGGLMRGETTSTAEVMLTWA